MKKLQSTKPPKSLHAQKAALGGLGRQHEIATLLSSWRTHPMAHQFWKYLLTPSTFSSLAFLRPILLPSQAKPDIGFSLQFQSSEMPVSDIFLSHKNIQIDTLYTLLCKLPSTSVSSLLEQSSESLWDALLVEYFGLPVHAQHHLGRIHFQKAEDYDLFSGQALHINAALLDHFIDTNPLWQQEPQIFQAVMEHLNLQRTALITSIAQGLPNEVHRCSHMSLSLTVTPPETGRSLNDATQRLFQHLLTLPALQNQKDVVSHLKTLQSNNHSLWHHIEKVCAHFSHLSTAIPWEILYYQFLSFVLRNALDFEKKPNSPPTLVLTSLSMHSLIPLLIALSWSCTTPQGIDQLGILGNAWIHLQRGKSLSQGTQTDIQVKMNAHFVLFYAWAQQQLTP